MQGPCCQGGLLHLNIAAALAAWKRDAPMGQHVVIASSDDIVRSGLHMIFAEDARVSDVYEVASNEELQTHLVSARVDLVVIDQALGTDLATLPRGNFALLATEPDMALLQAAYQYKARAYLSVHASKDLLRLILSPKRESFLIDPTLTPWIIPHLADTAYSAQQDALLTERQRQVEQLAREGLSRRAIAEQLCIAESTVKTHLKHIAQKRNHAQQVEGTLPD